MPYSAALCPVRTFRKGTQFTCFTSPKVQILTQKAVQDSIYFVSKKVQILTKMDVCPASHSLDTHAEACLSELN